MANQNRAPVAPVIQYKAICVYEAPTVDVVPDFIHSVNVVIGLFDTHKQALDACCNQPEHAAHMGFRIVRVDGVRGAA